MQWYAGAYGAIRLTGETRRERCQDLTTLGTLGDSLGEMKWVYRGVGEACLAALGGPTSHWQVAINHLAMAQTNLADRQLGCLDTAMMSLLTRLVKAHQNRPNSRPRLVEASGTACEWGITKLSDYDTDGPARGPLSGESKVRIEGNGLVNVTAVYFGGVKVTRFVSGNDFGGQFMYACSPPSPTPRRVQITVVSSAGKRTSQKTAVFEYSTSDPPAPQPCEP